MRTISKVLGASMCVAAVSCAQGAHDGPAARAQDIARACAGASDADVTSAIAALRPNIESVESKYEMVTYPKGSPPQRLAGALIHVRATPGTTAPWLTRVLSCHALRHVPEACAAKDRCPLAAEGARVATATTSAGFAITIEAEDSVVAAEILRRSQELAPGR